MIANGATSQNAGEKKTLEAHQWSSIKTKGLGSWVLERLSLPQRKSTSSRGGTQRCGVGQEKKKISFSSNFFKVNFSFSNFFNLLFLLQFKLLLLQISDISSKLLLYYQQRTYQERFNPQRQPFKTCFKKKLYYDMVVCSR